MKKKRISFVVCMILTLLFGACGTAQTGTQPPSAPEATEAPTATEAPKATAIPVPTATPKLTATPVPYDLYTFDFNDLEYLTHYGCSYEVTGEGVLDVKYDDQYGGIRFYLKETFDLEYCENITIRVKSEYESVAIQLYDDTIFSDMWLPEKQIYYGNRENGIVEYVIYPESDEDIVALGVMSLGNPAVFSQYKVSIYDITFQMKKGYEPVKNQILERDLLTEQGDVSYLPGKLEEVYTDGARYTVQKDGSIKLWYDRQYGNVKFLFPEVIDLKQCLGITVNADVSEGIAISFYGKNIVLVPNCNELFARYTWDMETTREFDLFFEFPEELPEIYGVGFMSTDPVTNSDTEIAQIFGITFHMVDGTDWTIPTDVAPDVTEDMTLLNTYGTEFEHLAVAASSTEINHPAVLPLLKRQYNSVSYFGVGMEPDYLCGTRPKVISVAEAKRLGYYIPENYTEKTVPVFDYTEVDRALEACGENRLELRLHTLIWHEATSEWFFREGYSADAELVTPEVMDGRVEFYIRNVMEHVHTHKYGYVVYTWDLVNEYYHSDGISDWKLVYGEEGLEPDFVKLAYQVADETLRELGIREKVSLLYNDYNTFYVDRMNNTPEDLISLIRFINSDGKICDGIGMQAHMDIHWPGDANPFVDAVKKFVAEGLEVQLTEFEISISQNENRESSRKKQAELYASILTELVKIKRNGGNITGITFWGSSDLSICPRTKEPLLFNRQDTPKDAYYEVLQAYLNAGFKVE